MRGISTVSILVSGIAALVCLGVALAIPTAGPLAQRTEGAEPPQAPDTSLDTFFPVDTSRFMGSPDDQPTLGVERAFPHLKFTGRNGFRGRWFTVETQPKRQKRRGFVASNRGSDGG